MFGGPQFSMAKTIFFRRDNREAFSAIIFTAPAMVGRGRFQISHRANRKIHLEAAFRNSGVQVDIFFRRRGFSASPLSDICPTRALASSGRTSEWFSHHVVGGKETRGSCRSRDSGWFEICSPVARSRNGRPGNRVRSVPFFADAFDQGGPELLFRR